MEPDGNAISDPMPMRLEFNIHNSCNLQCIMCHGFASSSIRTQREGLPAMANPYDEAFADQLEPFLPYVVEADFMGGEPFMIPVYRMLWERIAVANPRMKVVILTNGTILDNGIKELLESLNCWMHMSMDSHVKQTYESIRRGASFDQVIENSEYYRQLMHSRGLAMMWRHCPMRKNWREIPDLVRYCNERGILLTYNQLDSPLKFSLNTLSRPQLQSVVSYLCEHLPQEGSTEAEIHNRGSYAELIARLEGFLVPENRMNLLRARLVTSETVIRRYSSTKKKTVGKGVSLPVVDESADPLVEDVRLYVDARLSVDQAQATEGELPEEFTDRVSRQLDTVRRMMAETETRSSVRTYLSELVRCCASGWGVDPNHSTSIFDTIDSFAALLAEQPEARGVVEELLTAPPLDVYGLLSSQAAEELVELLSRIWFERHRVEEVS
jgi:hypothetical protein